MVDNIGSGDVMSGASVLKIFSLDDPDSRRNLIRKALFGSSTLYEEVRAIGIDAALEHPKPIY